MNKKDELANSETFKMQYLLNDRDKNNIKKVIEKARSYNYSYILIDGEIRDMFESLFNYFPDLDVMRFQNIIKDELGFIPCHAIMRVVNRWNQLSPNERNIDIEPFLASYKRHLYGILSDFMSTLQSTNYLKDAFDAQWENSVTCLIDSYNGNDPFGTDTRTVFIGFLQEAMDGRNFIDRLDKSFGAIWSATTKRKTLRSKLRDPARQLSTYLGTVFEIFIVAHCAQAGLMVEYEPKVGNHKAEALVKIAQTHLLIEASVVNAGRKPNFCGTSDLQEYSNKIYLKIKGKAEQLKESNYPILIFIVPSFLITLPELKTGLQNALLSEECNNIAGIVVSNDYKAHCLKLVKNPNCKHPLGEGIWSSLVKLYSFRPLQIDDIWE